MLLTRSRMRRGAVGFFEMFFLFFFVTTPAFGQTPHVRGEGGMQRLVDGAAQRSPAIREWIDRLEVFTRLDLDGRIGLLSVVGGHRFLIIELACGRSEVSQMATLGHELFHAIEIAEQPSVVSAATLADLYSRIGIQTGDHTGRLTFETEAAAAAGLRARRQLLSTRTGHGT